MQDKPPGSIRLFHVFGIHVFIHWTWLLGAAILYQYSHASAVFFVVYPSLFGIVLLHEFGHALACRSVGGQANRIMLFPLGGIAYVQPPHRPGAMLWSLAAGPLVNVLLVPVSIVAWITVIGPASSDDTLTWVQEWVMQLTYINAGLLIFNLMPIYPLDGGQICQSLLWFVIGYRRSLQVTAGLGLLMAGGVFVWSLGTGDHWMMFMSAFLGLQAWRGYQYARRLAQIEQLQQGMIPPPWENRL